MVPLKWLMIVFAYTPVIKFSGEWFQLGASFNFSFSLCISPVFIWDHDFTCSCPGSPSFFLIRIGWEEKFIMVIQKAILQK